MTKLFKPNASYIVLSKIIGIGGVSRSGKTHLSHDIVWHYRQQGKRAMAIRQDDFVKLHDQIPTINEEINWEIPESIDYELLIKTLDFLSQHFDILVIDGHLIYANEPLVRLIDVPILLKTTYNTYVRRKSEDKRWGEIPGWYTTYIWEAFQEFGARNVSKPVIISADYPEIKAVRHLLN